VCRFRDRGNGYFTDPKARSELSYFAPEIRRWRDRFTPPTGEKANVLDQKNIVTASNSIINRMKRKRQALFWLTISQRVLSTTQTAAGKTNRGSQISSISGDGKRPMGEQAVGPRQAIVIA
jgi:hypothetical protein